MAYKRSLITRAGLFNQQRLIPSFAYIHHDDDNRERHSLQDWKINIFIQRRSFRSSINNSVGFDALSPPQKCPQFVWFLARRMSSTSIGEGAEKSDYMAPAVSEVALAAADSYFPVAYLQNLIDGVHNFTGFNCNFKLTLIRPRLEDIKQEMQERGMTPTAVAEGEERMQKLFNKYGVTPLTPLRGLFIQGPVFLNFFLAIQNMVEKVPSFKDGGAFWFTDLTTPDSLYIFPVLTSVTFWLTVECNMQAGMEGNPAAGTMKQISRVFAVLVVPITMSFPKALFCYWVTSNLFSLLYGLVINAPGMKEFLGVPIIPVEPSTVQPASSFYKTYEKYAVAQQQPVSSPTEASKPVNHKYIPSSSVISQRLRSLEKEGKRRNKGKKS